MHEMYDDRFAELYKIIKSYLVIDEKTTEIVLSDDASDEVKKAYEEWLKYE